MAENIKGENISEETVSEEVVSEDTTVETEATDTPAEVPTPKKAAKKPEKSTKKAAKKPNFFARIGGFFARIGKRIAKFFREYNSERKKVVWKPVREVFKSLGIVAVSVAAFSLVIYLIDLAFGSFIEWLPTFINFVF